MIVKKRLLVAFLKNNYSLHSKTQSSLNYDAKASLYLARYNLTCYNKKCWILLSFFGTQWLFILGIILATNRFLNLAAVIGAFCFLRRAITSWYTNPNLCRVPLKR